MRWNTSEDEPPLQAARQAHMPRLQVGETKCSGLLLKELDLGYHNRDTYQMMGLLKYNELL